MRKYIYICDKCKTEEITKTNSLPVTWNTASVRFHMRHQETSVYFCNPCSKLIGWVEEVHSSVDEETNRDKLFDTIVDIIAENPQG